MCTHEIQTEIRSPRIRINYSYRTSFFVYQTLTYTVAHYFHVVQIVLALSSINIIREYEVDVKFEYNYREFVFCGVPPETMFPLFKKCIGFTL